MKEQTCLDLRSFFFSLCLSFFLQPRSSDALPASSLLLLLLLFLGTMVLPPDVCICTSRVGRVIRHVFVWAIDPINVAAAALPCRVHNSPGDGPFHEILRSRDGYIREMQQMRTFLQLLSLISANVNLALLNLSPPPVQYICIVRCVCFTFWVVLDIESDNQAERNVCYKTLFWQLLLY